jgi:hypothetical protein
LRYTPETAVDRKRFPHFLRLKLESFEQYMEITRWAKAQLGFPNRDHKDALWACQLEGSLVDEMWVWFKHEEHQLMFTLTWC